MGVCIAFISAALLFLAAATASGQQTKPAAPPIVQPGAPGQSGKILSPATAGIAPRAPSEADIDFMQGMIHHHSQAVEMTGLLRTRSQNKDLLTLGERISISQTDEMEYMKQWLADRGKPVSDGNAQMGHMDHAAMGSMPMGPMPVPMMPGMLTPQQMQAL